MKDKKFDPVIATHHEARRDYLVLETFEAGIVLKGSEVKSLRARQAALAGSFARLEGDEVVLYNLYIAPYPMAHSQPPEPRRERKLLLHRSQIEKLKAKTVEKGLTLVPLKLYFNDHGLAKVELAVARSKRHEDRRTEIKKRDVQREIDRAIKSRNRNR